MTDERASPGGFFGRLWRGELGLLRTGWFHFVLVDVLGVLVLEAIEPLHPGISAAVLVLLVAYLMVAAVGVWRAADLYHGPFAWGLMAKAAVLVFALQLLMIAGALVGLVAALIP